MELPRYDDGGGPAGVEDSADDEGGGPAGVVEEVSSKLYDLALRGLSGVEGCGLDE